MLVVAAIVGYLFGTFPSADLASRIATRGTVNLHRDGSGNPGGLNAMHQIGTGWGIAVIVSDLLKGTAGALAGWAIGGPAGAYAAATTSMAGHIFPVWNHFRGGKGVATSAGACLAVFPAFFPIDAAVAAAGALGTRNPERTVWVSGSVWVATALIWWGFGLPNLWGPPATFGLVLFAVAGAAMVLGKFRFAAIAARRAGSG